MQYELSLPKFLFIKIITVSNFEGILNYFCVRDQTQDFVHAKYTLYHWIIFLAEVLLKYKPTSKYLFKYICTQSAMRMCLPVLGCM